MPDVKKGDPSRNPERLEPQDALATLRALQDEAFARLASDPEVLATHLRELQAKLEAPLVSTEFMAAYRAVMDGLSAMSQSAASMTPSLEQMRADLGVDLG